MDRIQPCSWRRHVLCACCQRWMPLTYLPEELRRLHCSMVSRQIMQSFDVLFIILQQYLHGGGLALRACALQHIASDETDTDHMAHQTWHTRNDTAYADASSALVSVYDYTAQWAHRQRTGYTLFSAHPVL